MNEFICQCLNEISFNILRNVDVYDTILTPKSNYNKLLNTFSQFYPRLQITIGTAVNMNLTILDVLILRNDGSLKTVVILNQLVCHKQLPALTNFCSNRYIVGVPSLLKDKTPGFECSNIIYKVPCKE